MTTDHDTILPSQSPRNRHVALLIETSNEYARGLLRGIQAYIQEHHPWSIYLPERSRLSLDLSWLDHWTGHGVIARLENDEIAQRVHNLRLPTVNMSSARILHDVPCVETNDRSIAHMAVNHLLEHGFRSFGYVGDSRFVWSENRKYWFQHYVHEAGYSCETFDISDALSHHESWRVTRFELGKWLRQVRKPTGIMACYDILGQQILDACNVMQIAVPQEIGVLGVDNDQLLCTLSYPSLSSVSPDTYQTGYVAAALLDRMMSGEIVTSQLQLIEPIGIVERMSTDHVATDDELALRPRNQIGQTPRWIGY